jgi:hypothetical protein
MFQNLTLFPSSDEKNKTNSHPLCPVGEATIRPASDHLGAQKSKGADGVGFAIFIQ